MRRTRQPGSLASSRHGAVLVLAIFFIMMASALAVIIMASTVQFARTTRHENQLILLRQLIDSANEWVQARGGLPIGTPVTLSGDGILPENVSGQVTIGIDDELQNVIVITAKLRSSGHVANQTARYANPYPNQKLDPKVKPPFGESHPSRDQTE